MEGRLHLLIYGVRGIDGYALWFLTLVGTQGGLWAGWKGLMLLKTGMRHEPCKGNNTLFLSKGNTLGK